MKKKEKTFVFLQFDESTNIVGCAQFVAFVRFKSNYHRNTMKFSLCNFNNGENSIKNKTLQTRLFWKIYEDISVMKFRVELLKF